MTTELVQGPAPTTDAALPLARDTTAGAQRILGLACRNCGRQEPVGPSYVCAACFGPLDVAYDLEAIGATLTREAIEDRPPGIWRYLELLPVDAPPARGLPVGSTPLVEADRLAAAIGVDRLWVKDDTRNPSLSFKDRAVAIAAGRVLRDRHAGLRLHRQSRGRDGGGSRGSGDAGLCVHPGRP
jgi:hypothetical protein